MRKFAVSALILFFAAGSTAYVGHTMLVDGTGQDLCAGGETNTLNHSTHMENDTLIFEGVFCAPNTGYAVREASVNVEGTQIEALLEIEGPDENSFVGMAVTPMKFEESVELEPGSYSVKEKIDVEGLDAEGDEFNVEVEGDTENQQGFISGVMDWFRSLF